MKKNLCVFNDDTQFLHRRNLCAWCTEIEKSKYKYLLIEEARQFSTPSEERSDTAKQLQPAPKKTKSLFNFIESKGAASKVNADGDVNQYLDSPCVDMTINPAMYWSDNVANYSSLVPLASNYSSCHESVFP